MYVKNGELDIESTSKRGFEKGNMPIVIIVESTRVVSSIPPFEP